MEAFLCLFSRISEEGRSSGGRNVIILWCISVLNKELCVLISMEDQEIFLLIKLLHQLLHQVSTYLMDKGNDEEWQCFQCRSKQHGKGKCRFWNEKCYQCGKTGQTCHICRQRNVTRSGQAKEHHRQEQRVFSVTNENSDSSSDVDQDHTQFFIKDRN